MNRTIYNPIIKDTITYLATSQESLGRLTDLQLTLAPGGANPLHYHKTFSETFTAIEGILTLEVNGKKLQLHPGERHVVYAYQRHRYFNLTKDEIRFKAMVEPGHEGFENSLRIGYGLAADGLSNSKSIPKSLKHTAVLLELGDIHFTGLMGLLLSPTLKRLGKKAASDGTRKALLEKYCK